MITPSITWLGVKPSTPVVGSAYMDSKTGETYLYDGSKWALMGSAPVSDSYVPTEEQLEKHPSLKAAWEEFLVIRKLLGI